MIPLPTKTLGRRAKAFIKEKLPTVKTLKKVNGSFVLRDVNGVMLGHVDEGTFKSPKAVLILAK
ncbi:MAG: hypothetical protein ACI87J_001967 [Colwellia sp.]|jgi:hypothetical protein